MPLETTIPEEEIVAEPEPLVAEVQHVDTPAFQRSEENLRE